MRKPALALFICCLLSVGAWGQIAPRAGSAQAGQPDELRLELRQTLSFVDGAGLPVTTAAFQGKWLFVYFGYMHCADLCPLGLSVMGEAIDALGAAAKHVQPLFVTIDPERDHGAALTSFARAFHPQLVGLTGTSDQIRTAAEAMGVVFRKAGEGADYTVDHSSSYSLVDPQRRTVLTFKHAEAHLVSHRIVRALLDGGADLSGMTNLGALR